MNLNHLKRALALVLALVCAVPVAFAQEDPVAAIVEEATAAYVDEAVEELGELSLGEFVVEEPVEEVPEEEEVTEEAADEEEILDEEVYELIDFGKWEYIEYDDPIIQSMSRDGDDGCWHYSKMTYLVGGKGNKSKYKNCDDETHWEYITGSIYRLTKCMSCGKKMEYKLLAKGKFVQKGWHVLNSKYVCKKCGVNRKGKGYIEVRQEYVPYDDMNKPVNDNNAEGHLWKGNYIERTHEYDPYEGWSYDTSLDVILEADVQWREPHNIVGNKCQDCGYKTGEVCAHANTEMRKSFYNWPISKQSDEYQHYYYGDWKDYMVCLDCGYVYSSDPVTGDSFSDHFAKEALQDHEYVNGICDDCGYQASFSLSGKTLKMGVGEKYTLKYAFTNELGECDVTFSSGKKSIATVDKVTGEITAQKTGTVTITAKAENGKKATCKVTVYKKPTSITLNKSELVLGVGETATLSAKLSSKSFTRLTWTVDEANPIVSFDETGLITANAVGATTVTATTHNGLTAVCSITVKAAPTDDDIAITVDKGTIGVKETTYVRTTLSDNCAGKITYSTEDSTVTVDKETGKVTGKAVGKAIVVATAYNGAATAIEMEIKAAPSKVRITNAPKKLGVAQKYQLEVKLGAEGEDCEGKVTFSSSSSKIASVDKNTGLITPKKPGTVKITATSHHSKKIKHTVTIKVYKKPKSVKLNKRTLQLGVGESYDLDVKLSSGSYSPIKWVNENPEYISLDQNGNVTANAVGHAAVVAYLYDEHFYDICEIDVGYAPEDVEFDIDVMVLHAGQKATFTAKPVSSKGDSYGKITYSSSDKAIATVDKYTGKVTPKKYGAVTITATAYNGASGSYDLAVLPAVKSVKINIPSRIPVGTIVGVDADGEYTTTGIFDYITISPDKVGVSMFAITDIKSSKPSVADVGIMEEDGMPVLVAFKKGKFTLTVKTYNGKTAKKTITVY